MQRKVDLERDPLHHMRDVKEKMKDLIVHLRQAVEKVDEPKAQALFETSAEVIVGLIKALDDYEAGDHPAWHVG